MRLDHLAIAAETLEEGVAWAEEKLGVPFLSGGNHARFATHNRLLGLAGGLYIEVISPDPNATCDGPRWFGLDRFRGAPRLVNWICEATDFSAMLRYGMCKVPMSRGDLRWDMGVPKDGSLPLDGGFPTVLQWHCAAPGQTLPPSGCALRRLIVTHPQADEIEAQIALNDPRVQFKTGDMRLSAMFDTPNGPISL